LACGPGGKKVTGDLAGCCAPGKKEERGKKGADRWDRTARERKGESWLGLGRGGKEREERGAGLGRTGPGRGPRGEKRGEREGELGRAKEEVWAAFFHSFSFPFLFLYSNHSNKSS
jgi:hypothetical protein